MHTTLALASEKPVSNEQEKDDKNDNDRRDLEVRGFQVEKMCVFLVLLRQSRQVARFIVQR